MASCSPSPGNRPVALVTGAARRLGRAIALEIAAHGFDLALHYRHAAVEAEELAARLRALGAQAWLLQADLADEAATNALVPQAQAVAGRIDAVVNNASRFEHDTVESFGHAAMERHWRANTAAPILLARALHAAVSRPGHPTGRGCVVNLLDQKLWNPNPDHLSYTLSKFALEGATTLLAQALAPRVRVCGVAPGLTLPSGDQSTAEFETAHRLTPLGRGSGAEDVAQAVRFLLQAPAVTGTTLLVDGGQHLQPRARDVMFELRDAAGAGQDAR
ncbi:MAG: short chain dehydrogenase [Rubrivivax sp. SCN 71-131]|jgi:NAD(P)-dependent dehydrogenase (short-subunit alcohol dehydrogenase family)|nr:MAG: short chain dehydrogenase [Rubrivivax sp. SCN 71-131]